MILITAALPYVNNVPHLGNIIGCVLSADAFARYCRLKGYECIYVCGTDEYGTATEIKALEEGTTPQEITERYHKIHKEIYEWFGISFDIFGRTTNRHHKEIVQHIFKKIYENGYIIEKEVEQFFDPQANMFLADRYIEGTCPYCGYKGARGDQCEKCGKMLHPEELIEPKSKVSGAAPIKKSTKHLFFDLSKLASALKEWIEKRSVEGFWSENARNVSLWWIKEGLKPRAITRDLKWGVPVPLEGYEGKVFYVWFDAPIGYISITASLTEDWEKWWRGKEVKLYQFMGKDNIPFHTLLFPGMLMATGERWTLVYHINTTEYLNYEGGKFSKSRGVGVFGDDAMKSGIPADVWRYYLFANRPEKADTHFTWDDFYEKTNSELIDNFANLINRVLTFIKRNFGEEFVCRAHNTPFLKEQEEIAKEIEECMEKVKLKEALHKIMHLSKNANRYFQERRVWEVVKEDREEARRIMEELGLQVRDLAILIHPFLPHTSQAILSMMGVGSATWKDMGREFKMRLGEIKPLFKKLEKKEIEEMRKRFGEGEEEVGLEKFDIEVGKIIEVKKHPNADKLYIEKVEMGDGVRQIVSGLVGIYTPAELLWKKVLILKNLKPAKLRGEISEGMLLAAEGKEGVEVLFAEGEVGEKVAVEGKKAAQKEKMVTIGDFKKLDLRVEGGKVVYKGKPLTVNGKEIRTEKVKEGVVR